jgi:large subunit ribosomal protein L3
MKGILGEKLGMTQVFTDEGRAVPVTVIKAGPCHVVQVKTPERDGYAAVQLSYGDSKRSTAPLAGHYKKAEVEPGRYLVEVRTDDPYETGQEIRADLFSAGERTDVIGVSRGKGFAGVMKRHGFAGLSATHGTERKHRSPGAVGACATPSRVFRGTKMAGHMGHQRVTVLNLEVIEADPERGLLLLKGAVPGPSGGLVMIRSSVKSPEGAPSTEAQSA